MAAIGFAQVSLRVDQRIEQNQEAWYLFYGQADSARELLSTIASSLMTFTGVVFSITILVLQIASSQFSPRVLRTFLEDRFTRFSMGMFVGSFTYAMVLLPEVREPTDQHPAFVPALSIFLAFVLVLLSVGVFVRYIHHMAHSIRAVHVIHRVADETRHSLARMYPEQAREPVAPVTVPRTPPDQEFPHDRPPGVVMAIEEAELLALACDRDVIIALVPMVGDFLPRGAPLFKVWGQGRLSLDELRDCVVVGEERTPYQDPAFGFRQLVDVAERALSPAINDPTTAVQALDQLHDLLRSLATRPFPAHLRVDTSGRLRLILPRPDWEGLVRLGLDEIREYGESSIQVARRLRAVLGDLLSVAPADRQAVLQEQLSLLEASARRGFHTEVERRSARLGSTQGQAPGSTPAPGP
ncbi:hypothetical protein BON30_12930 [Cystobacter ferrugineus]|uniref:DUF2254 domain-containing protein n=1 Tax=Cystobacter ferrugineus TaxID=83449 RepID=A0A1L9BCI4_9BACT|nr:hypothetical protein BON30_12930 [Cystobacter ferrugineus]